MQKATSEFRLGEILISDVSAFELELEHEEN